jgi:hypothetical protein
MIVDAQRIAVHQQHSLTEDIYHRAVVDESGARLGTKATAEQEISVAVHYVALHAAARQLAQACDDGAFVWVRVVIADPRLEQIPENEQAASSSGFTVEKLQKLTRDIRACAVEMQVGNEEHRHGGVGYFTSTMC